MDEEYKVWKKEIFLELNYCVEKKDHEKLSEVFYLIQRLKILFFFSSNFILLKISRFKVHVNY